MMKEIIKELEEKGYTYLIYNDEETWVSPEYSPIRARIVDD